MVYDAKRAKNIQAVFLYVPYVVILLIISYLTKLKAINFNDVSFKVLMKGKIFLQ